MVFDEEYRNSLMEKAETEEGLKELYEEAKKIDSRGAAISAAAANMIDFNPFILVCELIAYTMWMD